MKKLLLVATFIFFGILSTNAQEQNTFNLTVEISGLDSNQGNLMIGLYDSEDNFLKKQFKGIISKITDKKSTVMFKNIPKGEYAVSFVHDENDNKKMDTNFFGIPKEAYGCSNNAKGFMGPPKYKDAKFTLEKNESITININ